MDELLFNKIPNIDVSNSDFFKQQINSVIKKNISNWRDFINIEYNMDLEEDDPLNRIAGSNLLISSVSHQFLNDMFSRIKSLPNKMVINQILIELFKKTIVYTNKDLVGQLKKACNFLNTQKLGEYTAIVEYGEEGRRFKSKDWLIHQSMEYLDVKPSCIQNYSSVKNDGTFVIMDDGIYSGVQIVCIIKEIFKKTDKSVIYLLPMYSTKVGLDLIESVFKFESKEDLLETVKYTLGKKVLILWKRYVIIPSITHVLTEMFINNKIKYNYEAIDEIHYNLLNKAGSIVIFEHKIPDYKSLPSILNNFFYITMFDHYSHTPPYHPVMDRQPFETNSDYHFKCTPINSFGNSFGGKLNELGYLKMF